MAVLDAIFCQNWIYRYYSYNSSWSEDEEFFEMRNGEGGQVLILFKREGTVINGFSTNVLPADKEKLTLGLPEVFHEFIFGEPVNSAGTTFCLWQLDGEDWKTGTIGEGNDDSEELLSALDGKPESYVTWATHYFEGNYKTSGIPVSVVAEIFSNTELNSSVVFSLVDDLEDWELFYEDLDEISYPYHKSS